MRCAELGPDATTILAVDSMFTKRGRMGFHGGSLSKEVFPSAVPSCQNTTHQRNTAGDAKIVSPKLADTCWKFSHILLSVILF